MTWILQGISGLIVFYACAFGLSESRRSINYKFVLIGLGIQVPLAMILLQGGVLDGFFVGLSNAVLALRDATAVGTSFVFGYLGNASVPFQMKPGMAESHHGFILAFQALPMMIVVNALSMLLFYLKVIPFLVKGLSWVFEKVLGIGGALGLCTSAEIFLGQTEAPLLIKPYLAKLSRGELFMVMALGMATSSVPAMVLYSGILADIIPNTMGHIFSAILINIFVVLTLAQVMVPPAKEKTAGEIKTPYQFSGIIEAISRGTMDGMMIFASVTVIILVFIALVSLLNQFLGLLTSYHLLPLVSGVSLTIEGILGYVLAPVAWLMGIPWEEALAAGRLLALKTVLNELIAYMDFASSPQLFTEKSQLVVTYALCSFANFCSIGIQIAGFGLMVPERQADIASMANKSLAAGFLASCITGGLIGLFF